MSPGGKFSAPTVNKAPGYYLDLHSWLFILRKPLRSFISIEIKECSFYFVFLNR